MPRSPRLDAGLALALYAAISVAFFGTGVLRDPTGSVVGSFGADQGFFMWSLGHWLAVVTDGATPFLTDRIYAPDGFNLAWATVIPGPAFAVMPVTAAFGLVVAYNVLALAAPALAAWAAYGLCREVTARTGPALVGGYLFGFGSYLLGQTLNHVNLALVFPIPLAALVLVRHARGRTSGRRLVLALTAILVAQFLIFTEVFLTLCLFGAVGLALATAMAEGPVRARLVETWKAVVVAGAATAALVSPYVYVALAHPNPIDEGLRPEVYVTDVANLWTPTRITAIGHERFADEAARLTGNLTEQLAYVGIPLLLVAGWALWERRHDWTAWLLALGVLVPFVCSLGPRLVIHGDPTWVLPWDLMTRVPLVRYALPARFIVYAWLALAVIVALWLARPDGRWRRLRPVGAAVVIVSLLPNLGGGLWNHELRTPPFFASSEARRVLAGDPNVLVLPYGFLGNSMYWQARNGFAYRMAGGYAASVIPDGFARYPVVHSFYRGGPRPGDEASLRALVRDKGIDAFVATVAAAPAWRDLLSSVAGREPERTGGVLLWRVDPAAV